MFASLKNKIKEETGSEVDIPGVVNTTAQLQPHQRSSMNHTANNNNNRLKSRFSSTVSVNSTDSFQVIKSMMKLFIVRFFIISIKFSL